MLIKVGLMVKHKEMHQWQRQNEPDGNEIIVNVSNLKQLNKLEMSQAETNSVQ